MKTKLCNRCGGSIDYEPFMMDGQEAFAPKNCPACSKFLDDERKESEEREKLVWRKREWREMCPPLYRDTDVKRLPEQAKKVTEWKFNPKGLMIAGDTGKGKTRAAFLLMERLNNEGLSVGVFHGNSFAHQCALKFYESCGERWISDLASRKVVFFDDLGKFKLTERVEAELFGLIEMRIANLLPVIVTTNMTGVELKGKMTNDRGESLVRRLCEFCEIVIFK